MSDQILTEEELNPLILRILSMAHSCDKHPEFLETSDLIKLVRELPKFVGFYRSLLSVNAELSFKNQKLKEAMVIVVENMELIQKNHEAALEELK